MWCSWAQPIGRADRQMAARLSCYANVSEGHLPAAHLKRWAFMNTAERSATIDELVVNEKIFGSCNHENWTEFCDRFDRQLLVCTRCGEEIVYFTRSWRKETPSLSPAEFIKTVIRKYSQEDVLASLTIRALESGGWTPVLRHDGGTYICEISRNPGERFLSDAQPTRPAAVCQAAARLGRTGLFHLSKDTGGAA